MANNYIRLYNNKYKIKTVIKKRLLVPKYVTKGNAHRRFIINFMF